VHGFSLEQPEQLIPSAKESMGGVGRVGLFDVET
jgi:hypothetical protein